MNGVTTGMVRYRQGLRLTRLAPRRLLTALTAGAAGVATLASRLFASASSAARRLTATAFWGFAWFVPVLKTKILKRPKGQNKIKIIIAADGPPQAAGRRRR